MMVIVGSAVAVSALGVMTCASASAAPAWLAPSTLTASGVGVVGDARLAADPKGDMVSVWWREGQHIESASRPAESASWSAPVLVTADGRNGETPAVGISAQGDAVAVWQGGAERGVEAAARSASSGIWQAPVAISPEGERTSSPQVAVDAQGDTVAVWSSAYPEGGPGYAVNDTIQAAAKPAGANEWEPAVWVSEYGKAPYDKRFSLAPQVAIDAEGEAVAVWEDQAESASVMQDVVEAAVKLPGSTTWGPPVVLADKGSHPQVAMDTHGDAVAVWPGAGGLYSATLPTSSSTWQPPVQVSTTQTEHPHVVLDSQGDAVVDWESIGTETNTVQAAVKPAEGTWGAPVSLSEPVEYSHGYPPLDPSLAIDAKGSAVAVWDGIRSSMEEGVEAAVLPGVGASWQAPHRVAETEGFLISPLVSVDEKGNGVAAWESGAKADVAIEVANYDGSSPVLEGTSIPSTAQTGKPLTFAVSPLAVTTVLGQTTWSFGDGSQAATGISVAHAFSTPGTYRVTVTTADVLGNTTSVSNTVVVTSAPTKSRCSCKRPRLVLSKVRITSKRFRVTGPNISRGRLRHKVLPFGTAFRFALSSRATVQIEIMAMVAESCKKRQVDCVHARVRGTLTYASAPAGNDAVTFRGKVGKHVLRPGHYVASLTARNGSGHSEAVRLSFVVAQ
jgi:PKD repeat protein